MATPAGNGTRSFIDGPGARIVAVLVLIGVGAVLAAMHWDDVFAPEGEAGAGLDPAVAACIAERVGHVDRMVADGVVAAAQADSFRARAIQFCEQQAAPR